MKKKFFLSTVIIVYLIFIHSVGVFCEEKFPSALLLSDQYNFSTVLEGVMVTHDFLIENVGNDVLTIEQVKTDCGCTTTSYDRQILPGATGKVSIQFNTNGYGGQSVSKTISIFTNDKLKPRIDFVISGFVDQLVSINPKNVSLNGKINQPIQAIVNIIPKGNYPFKIIETQAEKGENIQFKLEEVKKENRIEYILVVENIRKEVGRYFDVIRIKTDNNSQPEFLIRVYGNISG